MANPHSRKFFSHFFLKKRLQKRLILKILGAMLISILITWGTSILTYLVIYGDAAFYQVDMESFEIGDRLDIRAILLPAIIVSSIITLLVGLIIGAYASRKYAVPVFKLEQWASMLEEGNLSAKLRFREAEDMEELTKKCNHLGDMIKRKFTAIKRITEKMEDEQPKHKYVNELKTVLKPLDIESDTVTIKTKNMKKEELGL